MQKEIKRRIFDLMGLLTQHNTRWILSKYQDNEIVCAQGGTFNIAGK